MAERLYQVKEVLERVKISRSTLYKWERRGKIPTAKRNVSGYRAYTESEVRQIERYRDTLFVPVTRAWSPNKAGR